MSENNIDALLVQQVLSGDKEAFSILVLKYQNRLLNGVRKIISDQSIAMDVVQESFYKAYKALGNFRADSGFYTWLYRIAINTAKNYAISSDRRPPDVDIDFQDAEQILGKSNLSEHADPQHELLRDELQEKVIAALNQLPEDLKNALILCEIGGLSYEEISKVMNCPVGTVRSRIFRARNALDKVIQPHMDE